MYATRFYQQYKITQTETAGKGELVIMLYQGALKFLGRASTALENGRKEEAHESLVRCQDIITELMGSLNPDAGDIAKNLFRIYEYMHHRLVQANIKKDKQAVMEVARLLEEMLPAWQQASKEARRSQSEDKPPARALTYAAV